jgi:hypothetical protein
VLSDAAFTGSQGSDLCYHKVDFRKRWNGLLGECQRLGFDPYAGDVVMFIKRDRRQLVAMCGDDRGLYILHVDLKAVP